MGDLSSMANQLGAGQAIDLLKGMVMPAIMSAVKPRRTRQSLRCRPAASRRRRAPRPQRAAALTGRRP